MTFLEKCEAFMSIPEQLPSRFLPLVQNAKGLIFDCDGTLVDSMPLHYLAWHKTMSRYGLSLPEDRFYALGGVPSDRIIQILSDEQSIAVDAKNAAIEKEEAFLTFLARLKPIAPVFELARENRGIKPIAVASGGFRNVIDQQLSKVGCNDWFDAIVTAEDTTRHKPEPDVFLEAARRLKIAPRECLVFEDADMGVEAAKRAEMPYIDVRDFYIPKRIPIDSI